MRCLFSGILAIYILLNFHRKWFLKFITKAKTKIKSGFKANMRIFWLVILSWTLILWRAMILVLGLIFNDLAVGSLILIIFISWYYCFLIDQIQRILNNKFFAEFDYLLKWILVNVIWMFLLKLLVLLSSIQIR